jgi:hypothetical protein
LQTLSAILPLAQIAARGRREVILLPGRRGLLEHGAQHAFWEDDL